MTEASASVCFILPTPWSRALKIPSVALKTILFTPTYLLFL